VQQHLAAGCHAEQDPATEAGTHRGAGPPHTIPPGGGPPQPGYGPGGALPYCGFGAPAAGAPSPHSQSMPPMHVHMMPGGGQHMMLGGGQHMIPGGAQHMMPGGAQHMMPGGGPLLHQSMAPFGQHMPMAPMHIVAGQLFAAQQAPAPANQPGQPS
jgi:hypothetical protein